MRDTDTPTTNTTQRKRLGRVVRVCVLGAAVVWAATIVIANSRNAEYDWFKNTYGPNRHSEHAEEWIIRDFFHDQRGGIFLDIGSYDYKRFSNTYYLEQELGWSGVAVDAQQEFAAGYAQYRPRTKFFSFFVSDRSDALESLFVPSGNRLVASSNKSFSDRYDTSGQERTVSTITLNDLLPRAGVTRVDFLSMDIELAEPKALAGFDLARYRPRLAVVEAHPDVRQQIVDYFADRGYRVVARYLRADAHNLWFAPPDSALPPGVQIADEH